MPGQNVSGSRSEALQRWRRAVPVPPSYLGFPCGLDDRPDACNCGAEEMLTGGRGDGHRRWVGVLLAGGAACDGRTGSGGGGAP